jgi:hypothetical protein
MNHSIDVRHVLATIGVPTLVLRRTSDLAINVEHGRYLARHIQGAKYVEFPGIDHSPWVGDANSLVGEIESFLTGRRREFEDESDRELATIHLGDHTASLPTAHGFQEYWSYLYHLDAMQQVSFPDINKQKIGRQ